jgi:hypothetical protein
MLAPDLVSAASFFGGILLRESQPIRWLAIFLLAPLDHSFVSRTGLVAQGKPPQAKQTNNLLGDKCQPPSTLRLEYFEFLKQNKERVGFSKQAPFPKENKETESISRLKEAMSPVARRRLCCGRTDLLKEWQEELFSDAKGTGRQGRQGRQGSTVGLSTGSGVNRRWSVELQTGLVDVEDAPADASC